MTWGVRVRNCIGDDQNTGGLLGVIRHLKGRQYRLCENYREHQVCNWAVPADDPNPYCTSCRLTRVLPDLSRPNALAAWARLEAAKRRLIANLIRLKLPLATKVEDPEGGLAFEFSPPTPQAAGRRPGC